MLTRLREHRSLLASILREIEQIEAERKSASAQQTMPEAQATGEFKGVLKALDGKFDFVESGEYVYLEKVATRLSLMLDLNGTFYVTNRRILFRSQAGVGSALSGLAGRNSDLDIPLGDIAETNIVYGVVTASFIPSVEFALRGGEKHRLAIRDSRMVYANRQEIVALIERLKKEA
jgi:hypothetical protein